MTRLFDTAYERLVGSALLPAYEGLRKRGTFRYLREFEENQWRSERELTDLQWSKLQALLNHAYETVPYYRTQLQALGLTPGMIRDPDTFARLPILDKSTVREHREQLASSRFSAEQLIRSATGGSTGEPFQFAYNRDSYERRIAAAMRGDGWAGWRLCGGEFYVWGINLMPQARVKRWKVKLHHAGIRRDILSSFDLNADKVKAGVERYNRARPRVVVGYATALYEFARLAARAGLRLNPPRGVIASAEKLYDFQRAKIAEVFGAPVFDRYGCREVMMIGAECEHHSGLHATVDNVYIEVVKDGRLCGPGEVGDILLTDLHNYGMPLIRYRVGDLGSWNGGTCRCGRGLPLLNPIEGRVLDVVRTASGRVISGALFPHFFKDFAGVRTFQVVQETWDDVTIRIALDTPLTAEQQAMMRGMMGDILGPELKIRWDIGPDVSITRTNKFRPLVSRLPADEVAAWAGAS